MSADSESSGIGLTLVKKIVERNGGSIQVESEPGEGTTFLFTVPDKRTAAASTPSLTVLIVDTNENYAKHTATLLGNLGHRVRHTPDWEDGRSLLDQGGVTPDILLVDPARTEVPFGELLDDICTRLPKTRIIACIAESDVVEEDPRLTGILTKPFTLEKLHAILGVWANE